MSGKRRKNIDLATILRYLRGDRRGKEAHELEKNALDDPFLAEALDGLMSLSAQDIEQDQLILRSKLQRKRKWQWMAAAAVILFVMTAGVWFFMLQEQIIQEATLTEAEVNEVNPAPEIIDESVSASVSELNKMVVDTSPAPNQRGKAFFQQKPKVEPIIENFALTDELDQEISPEHNEEVIAEIVLEDPNKQADTPPSAMPPQAKGAARMSSALTSDKVSVFAYNIGYVAHKSGLPMVGVKISMLGSADTLISGNQGSFQLPSYTAESTLSASYQTWPMVDRVATPNGIALKFEMVEPTHSSLSIFVTEVLESNSKIDKSFKAASPNVGLDALQTLVINSLDKESSKELQTIITAQIDASGQASRLAIHSTNNRAVSRKLLTILSSVAVWQPTENDGKPISTKIAIIINLP